MFVNHVHLFPAEVRADASPDAFARLADHFGFEGVVCFAPFTSQVDLARVEPNRWLADVVKKRPQWVPFGTLDPAKPAPPQVRMMVDLGFPGIKLHPAAQHFDLTGPWACQAYEAMAQFGLIANFHTGIHCHPIARSCDPVQFDSIAHTYKQMPLVFDHVGGWHFFREMVGVIVNNRSRAPLYAGITSVLDQQYQRYWYLGAQGLNDCRWQVGPDLMIYGLDFPYNQQAQIARDLQVIAELDWPEQDKQKLLGGNLKRQLGLEPGTISRVGGDPPAPAPAVV